MSFGNFKPFVGAQLNLGHSLSYGLVACWLFNEGTGTIVTDYSGLSNHGVLTNFDNPPSSISGWSAGPTGGALAFDRNVGSPDFVIIPYQNLPNFTYSFHLAQMDNSTNNRYFSLASTLVSWSPSTITLFANVFAGASYSRGLSWTVGESKHIVATQQDIASTVYSNGVSLGTSNTQVTNTTNSYNFIGGYAGSLTQPAQFCEATFSDVMIWNRALSAEEVAHLYAFPYCMFDGPQNELSHSYVKPPSKGRLFL